MAGTYNFTIFNGEDFDRTLTWSRSSTPVSQGGTPVDLTDYTASLTLGATEDFITTTTSANGLITLGGPAGTIRLYIPTAANTQFTGTVVTYRLFMINSAPEPRCLMAGNFKVNM